MTSDAPPRAYVWTWPAGATEPVVAGVLEAPGGVITHECDEVCELAQMTAAERRLFWGRRLLNPYALPAAAG